MLEHTKQPVEHAIHALELLGTNFVDEAHDVAGALEVWKQAMNLRYSNDPQNVVLKCLPEETNYAYMHAREPQTGRELENLVDSDDVYMQALLITRKDPGTSPQGHDVWTDVPRGGVC